MRHSLVLWKYRIKLKTRKQRLEKNTRTHTRALELIVPFLWTFYTGVRVHGLGPFFTSHYIVTCVSNCFLFLFVYYTPSNTLLFIESVTTICIFLPKKPARRGGIMKPFQQNNTAKVYLFIHLFRGPSSSGEDGRLLLIFCFNLPFHRNHLSLALGTTGLIFFLNRYG